MLTLVLCSAAVAAPASSALQPTKPPANPALQPAEVVYVSAANASLALCTCAKCGSTSMFDWLYTSVYGHNYPYQPHPPFVQNTNAWPTPPAGSIDHYYDPATTKTIAVVRDPLERYSSSWRSKVRCSRGMADDEELDSSLAHHESDLGAMKVMKAARAESDIVDGNQIVPNLLRQAGMDASLGWAHLPDSPTAAGLTACLSFEDFAMALRNVHAQGPEAAKQLNAHLKPQRFMGCDGGAKMLMSEFAGEVGELTKEYGLTPAEFPHTHGTAKGGANDVSEETVRSELCAIVEDEYAWQGNAAGFDEACVGGQYKSLSNSSASGAPDGESTP